MARVGVVNPLAGMPRIVTGSAFQCVVQWFRENNWAAQGTAGPRCTDGPSSILMTLPEKQLRQAIGREAAICTDEEITVSSVKPFEELVVEVNDVDLEFAEAVAAWFEAAFEVHRRINQLWGNE